MGISLGVPPYRMMPDMQNYMYIHLQAVVDNKLTNTRVVKPPTGACYNHTSLASYISSLQRHNHLTSLDLVHAEFQHLKRYIYTTLAVLCENISAGVLQVVYYVSNMLFYV